MNLIDTRNMIQILNIVNNKLYILPFLRPLGCCARGEGTDHPLHHHYSICPGCYGAVRTNSTRFLRQRSSYRLGNFFLGRRKVYFYFNLVFLSLFLVRA